jgi:cell division protein FtsA
VVDFGSREVRVLIARLGDGGALHILGHGTAPSKGCISQGVIQDLNAADQALKTALTAAEKEARVRVPSLFCGINGKNVESFIREGNVKLESDVVEQQHMNEALDMASRDILAPGRRVTSSVTAQEWYVDGLRVLDPMGIRGHVLKARVHFARLPSVIEDNLISCIEGQRRELEDLIFLPLAASLGCLTPEDMELGVAVLDMGRTTTGLAVFRDYRILGTHSFEWGGYHLTRDVAAGLQVSFDEADELVLEYGIAEGLIGRDDTDDDQPLPAGRSDRNTQIKLKSSVPGAPSIVDRADLDIIVYERAKELLTKVRQHLHARGLMKNLVRGLVLTGGAATIKNQISLAEHVFQVPCRLGMPDNIASMPHGIKSPEFCSAVGIVRHAVKYRAALNGRLDSPGAVASGARQIGRLFRKYFF